MENVNSIAMFISMAMFIDSDNTQVKKISSVINAVSLYGRITVKRAYGNWTKSNLKAWDEEIKRLAIKPVQQTDYVKGKNASDLALTIDAMDLLHTDKYDAFVIVSSDSDFTPLAIRLRESGKYIIGIGEEKTPESFITSCDNFIYLEKIVDTTNEGSEIKSSIKNCTTEVSDDTNYENILEKKQIEINKLDAYLKIVALTSKYQDDEGFVNVSSAGSYIKRIMPDFDISTYGYRKLPDYLTANPNKYETKEYQGKGVVKIIAYKLKE